MHHIRFAAAATAALAALTSGAGQAGAEQPQQVDRSMLQPAFGPTATGPATRPTGARPRRAGHPGAHGDRRDRPRQRTRRWHQLHETGRVVFEPGASFEQIDTMSGVHDVYGGDPWFVDELLCEGLT